MTEQAPGTEFPQWRILALILAGMALVGCAAYLAHLWRLSEKLSLDFRGARAEGSIENTPDNSYRLRLELGDRILARSGKHEFGMPRVAGKEEPIAVVYDPKQPTRFQPLGLSYEPGIIVGAVFLLGMACVLYARRIVAQVQRTRRAQTVATGKKKK